MRTFTPSLSPFLLFGFLSSVVDAASLQYSGICEDPSLGTTQQFDCVICDATGSTFNPWDIALAPYDEWISSHKGRIENGREDKLINPGLCLRGPLYANAVYGADYLNARIAELENCCPASQLAESSNLVAAPHNLAVQAGADPWLVGFNGQMYFFDGEDGKWYNAISDPSQHVNLNMRITTYEQSGTFIDGFSISTMGSDGKDHNIAVTIGVDKHNFVPECEGNVRGDSCIGNGAVYLEVDGLVVTKPQHMVLEPGYHVAAFNSPFGCKKIPNAHFHWAEQVAHMKGTRRLRSEGPEDDDSDLLAAIAAEEGLFDGEACKEWVEDRRELEDIFDQEGSEATIFIETPHLSLRVEYTMNMNDAKWIKHHRFDWFLTNYAPTPITQGKYLVGGVIGETAVLKYDDEGKPIMDDRHAILAYEDDAAYEVSGSFGKTFTAKPKPKW